MLFTACAVIGIVTTSATGVIYGKLLWNPLDIMTKSLEMGHGGRPPAFFAATSWYIAQIGTNNTANSISAANDLTVLFPRYVNIERGCIIAATVKGRVIVPWKILSSAETFLAFMGGYAVFLAPIAGILASDFLARQKTADRRPGPVQPRREIPINWRALLALIVAVSPQPPGLGYSIATPADPTQPNPVHISAGARDLYTFDWLFGFLTSIFVYTVLSLIFPARESEIKHTDYGHEIVDEGLLSDEESAGVKEHEKGYEDVEEKKVMGELN